MKYFTLEALTNGVIWVNNGLVPFKLKFAHLILHPIIDYLVSLQ